MRAIQQLLGHRALETTALYTKVDVSDLAQALERVRPRDNSASKWRRWQSMSMRFAAAITHEGRWYVAQCLEVEVASQGATVESAVANLREALELHFEDEPKLVLPMRSASSRG